jgi:hypothetical protein
VIGTAQFGSGAGASARFARGKAMPQLVTGAERATLVNLGIVLAALFCAFALPRTLGAERAAQNR